MRPLTDCCRYASVRLRIASPRRRHRLGWLGGVRRLGLTAGASAPELLVQEVISACRERFAVTVEELAVTEESVHFKLPRALTA